MCNRATYPATRTRWHPWGGYLRAVCRSDRVSSHRNHRTRGHRSTFRGSTHPGGADGGPGRTPPRHWRRRAVSVAGKAEAHTRCRVSARTPGSRHAGPAAGPGGPACTRVAARAGARGASVQRVGGPLARSRARAGGRGGRIKNGKTFIHDDGSRDRAAALRRRSRHARGRRGPARGGGGGIISPRFEPIPRHALVCRTRRNRCSESLLG